MLEDGSAALIAAPSASRDVPVIVDGGSHRLGRDRGRSRATRSRKSWGNTVALRRRGACREHRRHRHSLYFVRPGAQPAHGSARGLARSRRPELPGAARATAGAELGAIADRFNSLAQALEPRAPRTNGSTGGSSRRRTTNAATPRSSCMTRSAPACSGSRPTRHRSRRCGGRPGAGRGTRRARARHAGDHRSPADDQPKPVQSAAPDGARPRALGGSAGGSGARAGAPASRSAVLVFTPANSAELWRTDRPDDLSLRAGKPHQHDPPCAGGQVGSSITFGEIRPGQARARSWRCRFRTTGGASTAPRRRTRIARHAGARAGPGRQLYGRRRGRPAARRCTSPYRRPAPMAVRHDQCAHHRRSSDRAAGLPPRVARCRRRDTVIDARDIVSGYRLYRRSRPDVVIVDLALQGNGLAGLPLIRRIGRTIRARASWCSACTASRSSLRARCRAARADTCSRTPRRASWSKAFEKVRAGAHYLSGELAMQVALVGTGARRDPLADLTPRELQMLALLAQGKSYGRISEELSGQLQDRGEYLLAAQAQAECRKSARADPHRRAAGGYRLEEPRELPGSLLRLRIDGSNPPGLTPIGAGSSARSSAAKRAMQSSRKGSKARLRPR